MKIDLRKDYRKILAIPENATNDTILKVCSYALENEKNEGITEEMIEAATVLINPQTRKSYDKAREKVFEDQKKADDERKNKEADAKKIAEERENKAKRKATKKFEEDKRKIAKNTAKQKEKIIETYTDNLTANKAKDTSNYLFKKFKVKYLAALIAIGVLFYGAWNKDTIFNKDKEDIKNDDSINTISLQSNDEIETTEVETTEVEDIKDNYDLTITFTDAFKEEQVQTRAIAINNYYRANNYRNISNDEIANQIKFMNGSYQASNDTEAYDMQDSILNTFKNFINTIKQNGNYTNVVSEDDIEVGLGLDAYLLDNSPNKEIVVKCFDLFQDLLAAETDQERVNAANEFIIFEYELMVGYLQNDAEEEIKFENLDSNEIFLIGTIIQIANTSCPSIIGENGTVQYVKTADLDISIDPNMVYSYYDPYFPQSNELNYKHAWVKASFDLITTAEEQKKKYTIN